MFLKVTLTWPLLLADFEYDISTLTIDSSIYRMLFFFQILIEKFEFSSFVEVLDFKWLFREEQSLTDSNIAMSFSLDLLSTFI